MSSSKHRAARSFAESQSSQISRAGTDKMSVRCGTTPASSAAHNGLRLVQRRAERILLYGLGQDLANNQTFSVNVEYMEDCANIPTSLVADLAGVGVSVLLGILGGQVGVPITVDPGTLSDLIGSQCYDKTSSTVTVSVFVNGNEVASQQVTLRNKGDLVEAVKFDARMDSSRSFLKC